VALTLITLAGQPCRQGTTKKGHLRWNEVLDAIQNPGGCSRIRTRYSGNRRPRRGEVKVIVQLAGPGGGDKAYPPLSTDPEVNYVFGVYASKLGDWEKAKTYWTKVFDLLPDHVPAMVSISEALLIENKATERQSILIERQKIDPFYWKAQALLHKSLFTRGRQPKPSNTLNGH